MSEALFRRLRRGLLLPLLAIAALAALTMPGMAHAAGTGPGSISGTVTDSANTSGLAGATVNVYPYSSTGTYNSSTLAGTSGPTGSSGSYSVSGLTDGTPYVVEVTPPTGSNDVPTWYTSTIVAANATQVTIPSTGTSANTATASVALVAGGEITGTINNSSGSGVTGVVVDVENAAGAIVAQGTTSSGSYTINGIPAGSYDVYVDASGTDTTNSTNYTSQWYPTTATAGSDAALNVANATAQTVTAGKTLTLSPTLANGSEITGTIKDANGAVEGPVAVTDGNQQVTGQQANGYSQVALSNSSGTYTAYGVPTGNFYVDFLGPWTNSSGTSVADASGYYAGSSIVDSQNQASPVGITAAGSTGTANATLPAAGYISGTITGNGSPASGVDVDLFDSAGNQVGTTAVSAADGTYTTSGLLPGTYKVEFVPTSGNLAFQYYNGVTTLAAASTVTVSSGQTASSINGTLTTGGTVSGTVTSAANNAGLGGARVELLDGSGNVVSTALTAANGTYTLTGAAAGSYYVEFIPPANTGSQYQVQYYGNKQTLSGSTPITVTAGQTTSGINAALSAATAQGQTTYVGVPYSPQLTSATPGIIGTAQVGKTLRAYTPGWTTGTQFSYQWYEGAKAIPGATSESYTLTGSQYKQAITLVVLGKASGYTWKYAVSAPTKGVAEGTIATKLPTIRGTTKVGDTLHAYAGRWSAGTKYSFQWYANKKAIKGATKSSFKLTNGVKGKSLIVKVIGKQTGYKTADRLSRSTKKIA